MCDECRRKFESMSDQEKVEIRRDAVKIVASLVTRAVTGYLPIIDLINSKIYPIFQRDALAILQEGVMESADALKEVRVIVENMNSKVTIPPGVASSVDDVISKLVGAEFERSEKGEDRGN